MIPRGLFHQLNIGQSLVFINHNATLAFQNAIWSAKYKGVNTGLRFMSDKNKSRLLKDRGFYLRRRITLKSLICENYSLGKNQRNEQLIHVIVSGSFQQSFPNATVVHLSLASLCSTGWLTSQDLPSDDVIRRRRFLKLNILRSLST